MKGPKLERIMNYFEPMGNREWTSKEKKKGEKRKKGKWGDLFSTASMTAGDAREDKT